MAKRTTRGARGEKAAREPKATSKKPRRQAEVEVVEEAPGEGVDTAILVVTTLVLFSAILYVDKLRAIYNEGMFF